MNIIKKKFLSFIETKGIAKKILNYLEGQGTVEISLVGLRCIVFLGIFSLLINFCFITKFGIVIQQGIIFSVKVINGVVSNIMYTLKYFDEHSPGTLSFIGAIIGGGLGFWGAVKVFKKQTTISKKQTIKKLMHQLLYSYRMIVLLAETKDEKQFKYNLEKSPLYKELAYDNNWRDYISEIDNYEDTENIVRWFFKIENKVVTNRVQAIEHGEDIEKILNKYKFRNELAAVKREIRRAKSKAEKDKLEQIQKDFAK